MKEFGVWWKIEGMSRVNAKDKAEATNLLYSSWKGGLVGKLLKGSDDVEFKVIEVQEVK